LMRYAEKSHPTSECGTVADFGLADIGCSAASTTSRSMKSPPNSLMGSSSISLASRQTCATMGGMEGSQYISFYPFGDSGQMDKLVESVKSEQEKNGSILQQIMETVSDLSREKTQNTELKVKVADQEKQLQAAKNTILELESTLSKFKSRINSDAEQRTSLLESLNGSYLENKEKDELIEKLQLEFNQLLLENGHLKKSVEEITEQLHKSHVESSNQVEIINVLNEESAENSRIFEESRKIYRERLNNLEAQVARYYERNEVNFPDG